MSQLKKLAQNYQAQDGTAQLGDIDEDDEVPGMCLQIQIQSTCLSTFVYY